MEHQQITDCQFQSVRLESEYYDCEFVKCSFANVRMGGAVFSRQTLEGLVAHLKIKITE